MTHRELCILRALAKSGGRLTPEMEQQFAFSCLPGFGWSTRDSELGQLVRAGLVERRRRLGHRTCYPLTEKGKALAEAARWGHI